MKQSQLSVINEASGEVYYEDHKIGGQSHTEVYSEWKDFWIDKLSALAVLSYARCARDFHDRLVAELFVKDMSDQQIQDLLAIEKRRQ